jgi:hypothetical protein
MWIVINRLLLVVEDPKEKCACARVAVSSMGWLWGGLHACCVWVEQTRSDSLWLAARMLLARITSASSLSAAN